MHLKTLYGSVFVCRGGQSSADGKKSEGLELGAVAGSREHSVLPLIEG